MEAIRGWTGPEDLPTWNCDACGSLGGTRVRRCQRLPRVLVVWLKRFRDSPGLGERRVAAPVEHLDEDLDLTAHLPGAAGEPGGAQPGPEAAARYRTRAIVCHHGTTLAQGHYTSWVRAAPPAAAATAENAWVHYDDSIVGRPQSNLQPNVPAGAVLLFYEQVRAGRAEDPPTGSAGIQIEDAAPLGESCVEGGPRPGPTTAENDVEMDDPMDTNS